MRDYKNIDRLFQENLKDFEVFPPNKAWDAIEKKLVPIPKRRKVPFWVKISSVAALLILFFSIGTIYFIPKNTLTNRILQNKNNPNDSLESNTTKKEVLVTEKKETKVIPLRNSLSEKQEVLQETTLSNNIDSHTSSKAENSLKEKNSSTKSLLADLDNISDKSTTSTKNNNLKKEVIDSRFSVATIYAPIYINSFGDGSGVDAQFSENPTSGSSSYSYGVKFAYQLTDKFSLQSGVNMINLGYKTSNIYITPGVSVVGFSNLSSNPVLSRSANVATSKESNLDLEDPNKGSLNQVFGYIEIPVEIKYNITDGKFGVNLVGGFSTLLLNRDEVFVETNSFSQSLGSSNNLRSVNFSGNIGLDVDYSIKKNLYINISPMFKVQTNTFSKNPGSIQPYYLGVYTGLNYKF